MPWEPLLVFQAGILDGAAVFDIVAAATALSIVLHDDRCSGSQVAACGAPDHLPNATGKGRDVARAATPA